MWSNGAGFDPRTRGTGESQERAFGDNNDGMSLFAERGRNVLVVNNEYVNRSIIYPGGKPGTADDVRKGKAGHGVPVIEIAEQGGRWSIVRDSPCNRRITADTPMEITGPARGHALLGTAADPAGVQSLGTWNDCGNGRTPWGTHLACEENFDLYFSSSDPGLGGHRDRPGGRRADRLTPLRPASPKGRSGAPFPLRVAGRFEFLSFKGHAGLGPTPVPASHVFDN